MSLRQGDVVIDCTDHEVVIAFQAAALGWELGATEVATRSLGELTWTVLEDPEGNEFCVS